MGQLPGFQQWPVQVLGCLPVWQSRWCDNVRSWLQTCFQAKETTFWADSQCLCFHSNTKGKNLFLKSTRSEAHSAKGMLYFVKWEERILINFWLQLSLSLPDSQYHKVFVLEGKHCPGKYCFIYFHPYKPCLDLSVWIHEAETKFAQAFHWSFTMIHQPYQFVVGVFFLAFFFALMFTFYTANIRITCPSFSLFFLQEVVKVCREPE